MNKLAALVRASSRDLVVLVAVVAVLALIPLGMNPFMVSVATGVLILAMAGVGWNVLSGFAGQFSFGHAAYFGLGAYSVAILLTKFSISPWIGLIVGGVIGALFGLFVGWVSFRFGLKGAPTLLLRRSLWRRCFGSHSTAWTISVRESESGSRSSRPTTGGEFSSATPEKPTTG